MAITYFVSGNKNKFLEYQAMLEKTTKIAQVNISLAEIQATNATEVCEHKLLAAQENPLLKEKSFFIEDTALYFTAWKNFPGVYIKWMLESLGVEKIYQSLETFPKEAVAECTIGYFCSTTSCSHFFQGKLKGSITPPQKKGGFGWDALFTPENQKLSFAQMSKKQKNLYSHRAFATEKFQKFLQEK
jgi:non-canonical purine NTP pyrophosphatase (RdgB/HAM1 family)